MPPLMDPPVGGLFARWPRCNGCVDQRGLLLSSHSPPYNFGVRDLPSARVRQSIIGSISDRAAQELVVTPATSVALIVAVAAW